MYSIWCMWMWLSVPNSMVHPRNRSESTLNYDASPSLTSIPFIDNDHCSLI